MPPTNPNRPPNRSRRGASSIEYMLVLAGVVIPIALLAPMMLHMITLYTNRLLWAIGLPLG